MNYAMDLNLAKEVLQMRKMPDNRFQTFLLTSQATNNLIAIQIQK
jgi:hypothetical protein